MTHAPSVTSARYSRTSIATICAFLTLIIASVLTYAVIRARLTSHLDTAAAHVREKGLPATGEELNAFYDFGPQAREFADRLKSALRHIVRSPDTAETIVVTNTHYELSEPYLATVLEDSRAYIAQQRSCLDELNALLPGPLHVRYPTDLSLGGEAPLDHLVVIREGTRLFALDAILAALDGDSTRAEHDFGQATALAETLRDEPLFISQLVRNTCHMIVVRALQNAVVHGNFTVDQLKALQDGISRVDMNGATARGLIGDWALVVGDQLTKNPTVLKYLQTQTVIGKGQYLLLFRIYRLYDATHLADDFSQLVAIADLPPFDRLARSRELDYKIANRPSFGNFYAKLMLPALYRSYSTENRVLAWLNTAKTGLALARFESAKGAFPSTLNELVPKYLPEVPVDPFSGDPLRYRHTPLGAVVYSLGDNQQDDGGHPPANGRNLSSGGDITFEIAGKRN